MDPPASAQHQDCAVRDKTNRTISQVAQRHQPAGLHRQLKWYSFQHPLKLLSGAACYVDKLPVFFDISLQLAIVVEQHSTPQTSYRSLLSASPITPPSSLKVFSLVRPLNITQRWTKKGAQMHMLNHWWSEQVIRVIPVVLHTGMNGAICHK